MLNALPVMDSTGQTLRSTISAGHSGEGNKIDYLFIKNAVEVFQHGVVSETFQGRYPSDHMPVVADVRIP
jgi:endonuclease/exonuclease/phosphatase family metal-dependent hydrolase